MAGSMHGRGEDESGDRLCHEQKHHGGGRVNVHMYAKIVAIFCNQTAA
jgi:hypothetical protein